MQDPTPHARLPAELPVLQRVVATAVALAEPATGALALAATAAGLAAVAPVAISSGVR